jgi:hypothetical protein
MRRRIAACAVLTAMMLIVAASAITRSEAAAFNIADDRLTITGSVSDSDTILLKKTLVDNPSITTLVFQQCTGGTLSAALDIANLIRARGLQTVASRQCSSACAIAFLAGTRRSFDNHTGVTAIGLHMPRKQDGSGPSADHFTEQVLQAVRASTGDKLAPELLALLRRSWTAASGIYFVRKSLFFWKTEEVLYCDGSEGGNASKCKRVNGYSALSQGIVTTD